MPFDLQFIQPRQLISVTQMDALSESVVRVYGEDFASLEELRFNDRPAQSFFIETRTAVQALLPAGMIPATVETIEALSRELSLTETSRLSFSITKNPSRANGIMKLVQGFLRILLSNPGSDIFDPNLGGGALKNLGRNFSAGESGSLVSDMVVSVDRARKQIQTIQARHAGLPPDEKLLEAKVTKATFDSQRTALFVTIRLQAHSGNLAFANLQL